MVTSAQGGRCFSRSRNSPLTMVTVRFASCSVLGCHAIIPTTTVSTSARPLAPESFHLRIQNQESLPARQVHSSACGSARHSGCAATNLHASRCGSLPDKSSPALFRSASAPGKVSCIWDIPHSSPFVPMRIRGQESPLPPPQNACRKPGICNCLDFQSWLRAGGVFRVLLPWSPHASSSANHRGRAARPHVRFT